MKAKKSTVTPATQKKLSVLRDEIDVSDHLLLAALSRRFKAVEKVGVIKRKAGMPLYQKARWQEVVKDRLKRARAVKVHESFTKALLKLIHQEAIRIQKKGAK